MSDSGLRTTQLDDLLAVLEPGETVSYATLIERLNTAGRPTADVGGLCQRLAFRRHPHEWRGSEIVSWHEPYFDREAEGDWTEGTMYVTRRASDSVDD